MQAAKIRLEESTDTTTTPLENVINPPTNRQATIQMKTKKRHTKQEKAQRKKEKNARQKNNNNANAPTRPNHDPTIHRSLIHTPCQSSQHNQRIHQQQHQQQQQHTTSTTILDIHI
jgi:hypothetical protein